MPRKKTTKSPKKAVKKTAARKTAAKRTTKKAAPKRKTAVKKAAKKPNKKLQITYWESVQQGHAPTFDDHPNLKILILILIISFVIFLMMEIPVIYASTAPFL